MSHPAINREATISKIFRWATHRQYFMHTSTGEKDNRVISGLNYFAGVYSNVHCQAAELSARLDN